MAPIVLRCIYPCLTCFLIYPNGWFPPGETIPIKVKLGFECDDASGPFQHGLLNMVGSLPETPKGKDLFCFREGGSFLYVKRCQE